VSPAGRQREARRYRRRTMRRRSSSQSQNSDGCDQGAHAPRLPPATRSEHQLTRHLHPAWRPA
jgi:hypothetical protein